MNRSPEATPSTRYHTEAKLILAKIDRDYASLSSHCVELVDVMFRIADTLNARCSLEEGTIGHLGERVAKCERDLTIFGQVVTDTTQHGERA